MPHRFRVTVEHVPDPPATPGAERAIQFEVLNHDDLLKIVDHLTGRRIVPDGEAAEFAVGLKLLGEVVLRHRRHPPFAAFWPHLGSFMKALKEDR